MSLQVNLSSKEIYDAYQKVLNANGIDWALFTYEGGTNDLKVQSSGDGGLEELEEEFYDGRSVIIEPDKDRCAAVGTLSSLCLFAADVDGSVLCLQAAMNSPGL